jgi:hypothetical protein
MCLWIVCSLSIDCHLRLDDASITKQ